jgi:prepilin-type N-terminal cleavage/methylation domain-containing protein
MKFNSFLKKSTKLTKASHSYRSKNEESESGFTLIETAVAMVVVLIALLGVLATMTYAIKYNAGNKWRTQGLAVLQQEIERLRSAKFTPGQTDGPLLAGTTTTTYTLPAPDNTVFVVTTTVDDDPNTAGVQTDTTSNLKEIKVSVRLAGMISQPNNWQALPQAEAVLRRVRAN